MSLDLLAMLVLFYVVSTNLLLLPSIISSSTLLPLEDVFVCLHETQEISFVCNVTGLVVSWDINVDGVTHNVDFDSSSRRRRNRYTNGFNGINVTLESATGRSLLSRTVVRIPPFNISNHRLVVYCNRMPRALLAASKKHS